MDLKAYLSSHPELSLFNPEADEAKVSQFLEQAPMNLGGMRLIYERSPNFQSLLKCQGPGYVTFMAKAQEQLLMIGSVSIAKKWIQGRPEVCAYAGDFRTNFSRKAAQIWRKNFAEFISVLKQDPSFSKPKYILTAILKKNADAIRNIAQSKRDLGFHYESLAEIDMVNVFGRWPWSHPANVATVKANNEDLTALRKFLSKSEKDKLFGSFFDEASEDDCWNYRTKNWPGFAIENFLLQKNSTGEIVACTLPWDPGFAKRMTVTQAPFILSWSFRILKFLGLPMPVVGESLRTLYLTHLNISPEVDPIQSLSSFLQFARRQNSAYHMISFADDRKLSNRIQGYVMQKIPVLLYTITLRGESSLVKNGETVGFEMGLV
ncbi:MAG: hypothetical protein ACXVCY_07825 [Pseudobdellovibrionaceae bacterium]